VTVVGIDRGRKAAPPPRRSLSSYLLMPRPKDVVKGWLVVATYSIGVLSSGEVNAPSLLRAAVTVAAVELLVYQARYQWNDVRGFVADQKHPSGSARGRLPGPLSRAHAHVLASCAAAGLRLAIAGALIVILPRLHLVGLLGFAVLGVFGVAVAYEALRSLSTGRDELDRSRVRPGLVLLWLTVGAGYAVRGVIGLALALDVWNRPTLMIAAVATLWCYGIGFVTARWAVEVTAFAAVQDGRVTWNAGAEHAKEHQLALSRWIPAYITGGVTNTADWAPLAGRTPLTAPWNLATVAGGAAAALTGRLLAGWCSVHDALAVAAVGAVAALLAVYIPRWRALFVIVAALVLLGLLALLGSPKPLLADVPWSLLMSAYLFFITRTGARLHRANRLTRLAHPVTAALARAVVGGATWQAMQRSKDDKESDGAWASPRRRWN
jgi:hypothetical protein